MRPDPAELFYLTTFLLPRQPDAYSVLDERDWHACLGMSPQVVTNSFRRLKLIEPASLVLHVEKRFKRSEIEALLRECKLPCEGTKADLAFQLAKSAEGTVRAALGDFELLQCSDEGAALANAYLSSIANGEVAKADLAKVLGGVRKAKLFALWIGSAVLGGIIENNSDRIFMHFIAEFYGDDGDSPKTRKDEPEPTAPETAPFTEEELKQYYALYQLPEVIFLRLCLACYLRGESCPGLSSTSVGETKGESGLASFDMQYYRSKFVVLALEGNPYGGTNAYLMFQDRPDRVFVAWVYDLGDEENAFELRGFWEHKMSHDQLVQHNKEMSHFLADRVHAL